MRKLMRYSLVGFLALAGLVFAAPVVTVPNLIGYWRLDETATPAADDSGGTHPGTWNGSTFSATVPPATSPGITFSNPNSASFDGIDDFIDLGTDAALCPTTAITLACWVRPAAGNTIERKVIAKWSDNPGAFSYLFSITPTNTIQWVLSLTGGQMGAVGAGPLAGDTWYHLVLTYDSSVATDNIRIYVNGGSPAGTEQVRATGSGTINVTSAPLRIGAGSGTTAANEDPYAGLVDDFRLYNRALTGAEVTTLHAGSLPGAFTLTAQSQPSQVSLSWTASAGAVGNYIIRRAQGAGAFMQIGTTAGTTFTDSTGTIGTPYSYQITAVNVVGETQSNLAGGTPAAIPPRTDDNEEGLLGDSCSCGSASGALPWGVALLGLALLLSSATRRG